MSLARSRLSSIRLPPFYFVSANIMYGSRYHSPQKDFHGFAQAAAISSPAYTPPKVDPVKSDLLDFAGALTQLTDNLSTMYVKQGDKGAAYVAIDNCVAIAFHSNIPKVAQAQYRSTPVSGSTRSQSSEEYPAAYAATHEDMVHSGLSSLSLPTAKEAPHVTCTGAPFDPDNDERRHIGADPLDSSPAQLPIIPTPFVLLRLGQHNVSWFSVSQSC